MTEIVRINLGNEMDLILAHKRSMKLAELCGFSVLVQTSFATAVSEISRCVTGDEDRITYLSLAINTLKGTRKEITASIFFPGDFERLYPDPVKYARKLVEQLQIVKGARGSEVILSQKINFSGLINDAKLEAFISYFRKELPLSPYDELRKKNIQLLEISEKLRESEQEYRMLSETVPLMMFTTNTGGFLTFGNKWLLDFFKLTEVPAGKIYWPTLVYAADNGLVRTTWEKAMENQTYFSVQARLKVRPAEEPLWHLLSLLPVRNEQKQLTGWTGFFVDIHAQKVVEETLKNNTELKAMQRQLLTYQGRLEEKVKELNKSNHDLEQFAYIASHDLQEPLRKIISFSDMVRNNSSDQEKVKRYLGKIESSSLRMLTLVRDVLNYSRLSKSESNFEQVHLTKVVEGVKTDIELLIEECNAEITCSALPSISAIPLQIYQLFYNLINNAIKFAKETPVISITHRMLPYEEVNKHPDLHVSVSYVEFIFKDNGIGFDQKYAQQIFTIFKRLNSKESYAGTGIGLALCKKIVDNHHGLISASSEVGKGTEFHVILPVD